MLLKEKLRNGKQKIEPAGYVDHIYRILFFYKPDISVIFTFLMFMFFHFSV